MLPDWRQTGDPSVDVSVEQNGDIFRVRRAFEDGWSIETVYAVRGEDLILRELHITPRRQSWPQGPKNQSLMLSYSMPRTGDAITARLLRSVRLDTERDLAEGLALAHGLATSGTSVSEELSALVASIAVPAFEKLRNSDPPRPGRKGRSDQYLGIIAAVYVDMLAKKSPAAVKDTANVLDLPVKYVRDALHRARARGLLSSGSRGRAGGSLTTEGLEAVRSITP